MPIFLILGVLIFGLVMFGLSKIEEDPGRNPVQFQETFFLCLIGFICLGLIIFSLKGFGPRLPFGPELRILH